MLVFKKVIKVVDKNENTLGIETIGNDKDFYDILVKYMGHEVANYFNGYVDGLKREIQYLEAEIEELETEVDTMYRLP